MVKKILFDLAVAMAAGGFFISIYDWRRHNEMRRNGQLPDQRW